MKWSDQQEAIFQAVAYGTGHVMVDARAGTGKTTTAVEAIKRYLTMHPDDRVLACAFNVRNRQDFERKISDERVTIKSTNQVGFGMLRLAFRGIQFNDDKGLNTAREVAQKIFGTSKGQIVRAIAQTAALAKYTLASSVEDLERLIKHSEWPDVQVEQKGDYDPKTQAVIDALEMAYDSSSCDYDDQLWLPNRFNLYPRPQFDLVVGDEIQDWNEAQIWLMLRQIRSDGRLVLLGDPHQAVYGWRGATSDAMAKMQSGTQAIVLPLTCTYRCASSVVREANAYVREYSAAEDSPIGKVDTVTALDPAEGDFVLSRTNAPLIKHALHSAALGLRVSIAGRDMCSVLTNLIEQSKALSIEDLMVWMRAWFEKQVKKAKDDEDERRIEYLKDVHGCLRHFAKGSASIQDMRDNIYALFSDKDDERAITFSTVHRAKGLERDTVWILRDTFFKLNVIEGRVKQRDNDKREFSEETKTEERNIMYVAITRARHTLHFVEKPEHDIDDVDLFDTKKRRSE